MFKESDVIVKEFFDNINKITKETSKRGHNELEEINRPYNCEKRRLKSFTNFGVTSEYISGRCLEEFKNREHTTALIMNLEIK